MHLKNQMCETGHGQLDVAHALAAHARQRHFDAATVADHALVLDPLVFAAGALPVLGRTEDALAEEAALFRLEGAVVDRLGVLDFALAPGPDGVRRGDGDADLVEPTVLPSPAFRAAESFVSNHSSGLIHRVMCGLVLLK
jgi:hypothetical protein